MTKRDYYSPWGNLYRDEKLEELLKDEEAPTPTLPREQGREREEGPHPSPPPQAGEGENKRKDKLDSPFSPSPSFLEEGGEMEGRKPLHREGQEMEGHRRSHGEARKEFREEMLRAEIERKLKGEILKLKVTDISWMQGLYPRFKPDKEALERYREVIREGGKLPPIKVVPSDGKYILLDGFHRFQAYQDEGIYEVEAEVLSIPEQEWRAFAAYFNTTHGVPLRGEELKKAVELCYVEDGLSPKEIAVIFGKSVQWVNKLLKNVKEVEKEKRRKKILKLWKEGKGVREIARILDIPHPSVVRVIKAYGGEDEVVQNESSFKMNHPEEDEELRPLARDLVEELKARGILKEGKESDFERWFIQNEKRFRELEAWLREYSTGQLLMETLILLNRELSELITSVGQRNWDIVIEIWKDKGIPEKAKEILDDMLYSVTRKAYRLADMVGAIKRGTEAVKEARRNSDIFWDKVRAEGPREGEDD